MSWSSADGSVQVFTGDCRDVLATMPANHFHACVTDPPYHLTAGKNGGTGMASVNPGSPAGRAMISTGFMGKSWDGGGVAFDPATWLAVLRVMRPGAHLIAFGGSRTFHRLAVAIEDAGFELRDTLMWIYGSGFPKSLDVSKAIDKAAGVEREKVPVGNTVKRLIPGADQNATGSWIKDNGREYQPAIETPATEAAKQWDGWGSALKPAFEPIILARKPLDGTIAGNVLKWGCGALNIGASRVQATDGVPKFVHRSGSHVNTYADGLAGSNRTGEIDTVTGRYPANVIHDGSPEVVGMFPNSAGQQGDIRGTEPSRTGDENASCYGYFAERRIAAARNDSGTAARFFWSPKASASERPEYTTDDGRTVRHPTVKPLELMRYLVNLVTPPNGLILDPFAGSGTTAEAAWMGHWPCVAIDLEADHIPLIQARLRDRIAKLPLFERQAANTQPTLFT